MLGTRVRGAESVVGGMAVRVGPTLGRSSSAARGVMLLFFGRHRGLVPCPWPKYGRLVRRCVSYSKKCCISRPRSATAILTPDSESPGAHTQRHRPGPGPRVAWRGSTRDTAGGGAAPRIHVWRRGGGGRPGSRRRPCRARPAPPAPPRTHPRRCCRTPSPRQVVRRRADAVFPGASDAPPLLPLPPTGRSRQRGWHRPPRGAAR